MLDYDGSIKPYSNIPTKQYTPPFFGIVYEGKGYTDVTLMSNRQAKYLHLRRACGWLCGYCEDEANKYLDEHSVVCPACSKAGGADLPIRHLPPVCSND